MRTWRSSALALLLCALAATQAPAQQQESWSKSWDLADGAQDAVVLNVQPPRKKGVMARILFAPADKLLVDEIDGKMSPRNLLLDTRVLDEVRLRPGKHSLVLRVIGNNGYGVAGVWSLQNRARPTRHTTSSEVT